MANATTETTASKAARPRASGASLDVDPAIAAVIEKPGAPVGVPAVVAPPATLPGVSGFVAGMRMLVGLMRHGVQSNTQMRERFGDVYRASFIGQPVVYVWDADEIQRILRNESEAFSAAMGWDVLLFAGLDPDTKGNIGSLLSLDFDEHKTARKLVQPAFTLRAIEGYLDIARPSFDAAVAAWVKAGRIDFKADVRALLARVALEIFTGFHDPKQVDVVDRALTHAWSGMLATSRNALLSPAWRNARKGFRQLRTLFLALAPERRKQPGGTDLFSHLVAVAPDEGISDDAMVRVFLTIMFGAFDTTSAAVTSMGYLLAKHPEWQERVREEALRAGTGALDVAGMKSLKTLEWVWKETLRLMPVNSFVPRRALRDVEIGGHALRAGTLVFPMASAIGRHPRWWKNPESFDPERFSPERQEDKQHAGIFIPFGAGPHACVGMQLANMEMKLFFHRLLTSCRFTLESDYDARHTHTPLGIVSGKVALRLAALEQ